MPLITYAVWSFETISDLVKDQSHTSKRRIQGLSQNKHKKLLNKILPDINLFVSSNPNMASAKLIGLEMIKCCAYF